MKNMKLKRALLMLTLLVMTLSAVTGGTIAWFTDSVASDVNTIKAGNLDIELYHQSRSVSAYTKVDEDTSLFIIPSWWEPGAVTWENLSIRNEGDLNLYYNLAFNVTGENFVKDTTYGLSSALKVAMVAPIDPNAGRDDVISLFNNAETLQSANLIGALAPDAVKEYGVIIYWEPTANDNNWNVNNGKETSNDADHLEITIGVNLVANQLDVESDAFGDDYDAGLSEKTVLTSNGFTFEIPKAAMADDGAVIKTNADIVSGNYVYPTDDEAATKTVTYVVDANITVNGLKENNTAPVTVKYQLPVMDFFNKAEVYHNGVKIPDEDVSYDSKNYIVTFKTTSFSPFKIVLDTGAKIIPSTYTNDEAKDMLTSAITNGTAIDGLGRTIDLGTADQNKWALSLTKNATLRNMTLKASGKGQVVIIQGRNQTVKMKNVTLDNTNSSGQSLVLSLNGATSQTFIDCTFKGKAYFQGSNATFIGCSFNKNNNMDTSATNFTFQNCKFTASSAVTMNAKATNVLFEGCAFSGSAIRIYAGMAQPTNVRLINNTYKGNKLVAPDTGIDYEGWKAAGAWIEEGNVKN